MHINIDYILFIHILSATAWIGGSLLLFALGVFLRDKEAQKTVYANIGPLYGYYESVWLVVLVGTGYWMFFELKFIDIFEYAPQSPIAQFMKTKLYIVGAITFATVIHMYLAFKTQYREKTLLEKLVSRGGSLLIFILNIVIIWYALNIRNLI